MTQETIRELALRMVPWLTGSAETDCVVVSSRVRLARNLSDYPFPSRAPEDARATVWRLATRALPSLTALEPPCLTIAMADVDDLSRSVLVERRLISPELSRQGVGSGVVVSANESLGLMVNEEDHLRVQSMRPGLDFGTAWAQAAAVDNALCETFQLAFRSDLGFLTACPTNVGTGLRASAMMHLPGLVLMEQMTGVMNGALRLGFAVRGIFGEGTEATGNLFQISNQSTLGESEEQILARLERLIRQLADHEQNARLRLSRHHRHRLYDHVGRAYGILREARLLTAEEALNCLSAAKLGVELGLFAKIERRTIVALMLAVQPGHLQIRHGETLDSHQRDVVRADMVRSVLRDQHSITA